jgi:hypothetical protein
MDLMGYRDDFYVVRNIIGYTGRISFDLPPTIYFYDCTRKLLGHITQYHPNYENIGRQKVIVAIGYLIFNSREGPPALQSSRILGTAPIQISNACLTKIDTVKQKKAGLNFMIECCDSNVFHVSRSPFIAINKGSEIEITTLSNMIKNNPNEMSKYKI